MDSLPPAPSSIPNRLFSLPGWSQARGRDVSEVDAAYAAGIALKSLDDLVQLDPVWAGCWRSRQALKCAAVAVRLSGRNEDEHALRDTLLLTAPGDDSGPAGKVFLAFKRLSARKPAFSAKAVAELADLLGLAWDEPLAAAAALRGGGAGNSDLCLPSGCRAARLGACRCFDRRKTQMAVSFTAADGRTVWAGLPHPRRERARPPRRTRIRGGALFGSG
mgnify:CR=1 FL=1